MADKNNNTAPLRSLRLAPRWMKWTLGISLCFNLIIMGVVVGATARHHRGGGQDLGAVTMRQALRGMDESRREAAKAAISGNVHAMNAARRASAEARARLAELIAATPFDAAGAEAAFADMAAAQGQRRDLLHENFIAILSTMSDDERAKAAKHLNRWNRWHKR